MIIQSRKIWMNGSFQAGQLKIINGGIQKILPYNQEKADKDYGSLLVCPGFIDIHTHGWNKCDAGHPTSAAMQKWKMHMPHEGVTSFVATTATQSIEENEKAFSKLGGIIENQGNGAEIIGINVEGNYISHNAHGAQDLYTIVKPNAEQLLHYNALSKHHILTVTCAPECEGAIDFIKRATAAGIRVSMGHSAATYEESELAIKAGVTGTTHTGNGMTPFHHRRPGIFGAALCDGSVYAEVIGDGIHVALPTAQIIGTMKGKDRLILVTDSSPVKDDPKYAEMNKEGAFRLPDGTLFGSALYVNQGVYNLYKKDHLTLETTINAATINPAKFLGVDNRKGSIEEGKDADITVCTNTFDLKEVYCMGKAQLHGNS